MDQEDASRNDACDFSAKDFVHSGGRLFRRHQGRRTITVAYRTDGDTISYGATIHSKDKPSDVWVRRAHNAWAIERLENAPVVIPNIDFDKAYEREDYIRAAMIKNGCDSNRSRN